MRALLQRYAKGSRRGQASVAMTLQILHAFEASSAGEYHRRISEVPVLVAKSADRDALGREGVRTDYLLNGVLKASRFAALDAGDGTPAADVLERFPDETDEAPVAEITATGILATGFHGRSWGVPCEYEGWVDECATQQEIDDGYVVAIALDAEASAIESEITAEVNAYCAVVPDDCWSGTNSTGETGGPTATEPVVSCASQGWAFAGAAVHYGYRAFRLWSVIGAVNPPAAAIGEAVILGGVALAGIVATGIAVRDCIRAY